MTQRLTAFLSYGFRPFFLFAGLYGVVGMAAWLALIGLNTEAASLSADFPPSQWHAHEMLFGYTTAVFAGFLLTAAPGWTRRAPIAGGPLALLAVVWVSGRAAVWLSAYLAPTLVAVIDLSFLVLLFGLVFTTLTTGSKRHLVFLGVLALLFSANAMVHLERLGFTGNSAGAGHLLALDTYIVLITVIGGRVVPAFTRNTLRRDGDDDPLPPRPWLDRMAILSVVAVLVAGQVADDDALLGGLAVAAALINGLRLVGWRGWRILDQPIAWILHLGYGWMVAGLAFKGVALLSGTIAETTALHVLTIGAVGSMTLGIMTRAGLGHTGRALRVTPAITFAYLAVSAAAVIRVGGPLLLPDYYTAVMVGAGVSWCAAFAVFSWVYWPILTRPRLGQE
ncbi:MAG: NnrS family protein [Proteobacteria bacterium]|nr:NnrS family protein [Pseudomonadota bacterium]